jgi:hypothetical protein
MGVTASYVSNLTIVENITRQEASSSNSKITYDQLNTGITLDGTTSPAVTKQASFRQAMTTGAATVDLTAITPQGEAAVTGNGLKVMAWKIKAPLTNSAVVAITVGASNGLTLMGSAWKESLQPGQEVSGYCAGLGTTIDSTHKTLDMAGTGTDALDIQFVFG